MYICVFSCLIYVYMNFEMFYMRLYVFYMYLYVFVCVVHVFVCIFMNYQSFVFAVLHAAGALFSGKKAVPMFLSMSYLRNI